MKKEIYITILERIKSLLNNNYEFEAKEYLDLEINNLKEIIPLECQNTFYYSYFCNTCNNINCSKNKKELD